MEWHYRSLDDVFEGLGTSPSGLTQREVDARLISHGRNELISASAVNPLLILINQFKSFIVYILLFAVVVSLAMGEYVDTLIILIILIVNAVIGFVQELGAERSLEALKKISTVQAMVLRDGVRVVVPSAELVPGDIVDLEAGDRVPADVRIIRGVRLKAEESALTGESLPVEKEVGSAAVDAPLGERRNMLYSATTIATGNARAVVVATGMATELGKITALIESAEEEMTPLQRRLDQFGRRLGYVIIAICCAVFLLCLGRDALVHGITLESLATFGFIAISLAVAAVPTALPAVVTIALSIGVKRLLSKKALVRNLSAVETLGSCDVICTDKTGTLTENQMTVRSAWTLAGETILYGTGYAPEGGIEGEVDQELFRCGILCNNATLAKGSSGWGITGDPTEGALLVSAAKAGVSAECRRLDEIPFDSETRMMSVLVADGEGMTMIVKGAPEQILERCTQVLRGTVVEPLTVETREVILDRNRTYAAGALRVLAFARKSVVEAGTFSPDGLTFIGLQGMIDPPRPDVIESIARTGKAGIRVIMITGDYGETARAIGREIGITGELMEGRELEKLDQEGLRAALLSGVAIFARVAPEHKQRIVETLQQMGHTVAMTGDGVNDAPALKKANIGVAVGSGTEVAREAADFVLLDDSFTHIVNAIEEGRGIYENIQKSIMLLLSGNLGEVLIIFLAVLFGLNLPLTAILLLWINMVTDGAPALAYSVDPYGSDIMLRPPKPKEEGLLPVAKLKLLLLLGTAGTVLALSLFEMTGGRSSAEVDLMRAQTMVFNFVVLYEVILTFVIRASYRVPFFTNPWVWGSAALAAMLQAVLMYTPLAEVFRIVPLGSTDLLLLLGAGMIFTLLSLAYLWVTGRRGVVTS